MAYHVLDRPGGRPLAAFVHVPRTGGTFVRSVLRRLGFGMPMIGLAHQPLEVVEEGLFTFTFVRHPVSWYASLFAYREQTGWPESDSFPWQGRWRSDSLEAFLEKVAADWPTGYLAHLIDRATLAPGRQTDYVGRQETLCDDLAAILERIGVPVPVEYLRKLPQVNATLPPEISGEAQARILQLERRVVARWYP